ncbi:MAG: alpha/beta hydrolase family protein [Bryobacteraceae bacterium]
MVRFLLFTAAVFSSWAQSTPSLPKPSGKYSVGKVSLHWIDAERLEPATEAAHDKREIVVQIWYPAAKPGRNTGSYLPGVESLAASAAADSLSGLFGPSWRSILANEVRSNAHEEAPVASAGRLPLLVFSPGGGVPVVAYSIQLEDLASHGYVVVGVEPTHEAPGIVFPGGRVVTAANGYLSSLRRESGSVDAFEKKLADISAADIRFVLDKLKSEDREKRSIFHNKFDLDQAGVFGHSRGGRVAARVCQTDSRIKACLNQDGNMSWQPFWLDNAGRSMTQPFLMLDHFDPDPPDEVFVKMGTTRAAYVARRSARQAEAREKIFATIAGGSYHVKIKTPGVSHNSFADVRYLGRMDGAGINAWPEDVRKATPNLQILRTISAWTRAFFDKSLRGDPAPLRRLMQADTNEVDVLTYGPPAR